MEMNVIFQVVAIAHKTVGIIAQTRVVRLEDILESIGVAVLYSLKEFALFLIETHGFYTFFIRSPQACYTLLYII